MIGYKFYWYDDTRGFQFVDFVPERRRDPARITHESIVNLARKLFGEQADIKRIYFVRSNPSVMAMRSWDSVHPAMLTSRMLDEQGWEEGSEPSEHQARVERPRFNRFGRRQ